MVRCGISLYGYLPSAAVAPELVEAAGAGPLRPALSWKTQVSYVRELGAGERTSYGLAYRTDARADIATVPVGYADGVPRGLFERGGELLVGGRRRRVAGVVTMDQLLVDCGPDSGVRRGDEVVLIGSQADETVTAQEWADRLGTISYEILCRIGPRLPRRHVRGHAGTA
jgi:alanine racemase